jgi:voltage-gated potassium channel
MLDRRALFSVIRCAHTPKYILSKIKPFLSSIVEFGNRLSVVSAINFLFLYIIFMNIKRFRKYIGLAGVAKDENYLAQRFGKYFESLMLLIVLWLPIQLYLSHIAQLSLNTIRISNWLVWGFFVIETVTLSLLVTNKRHYILNNWLNWIIIVGGFPSFWDHSQLIAILRTVQLIILTRMLVPAWDRTLKILSRNKLGTTLIVFFILTMLWGVLISAVDPNIHSIGDGIWWAWQTVTTVGYGDIVPESTLGRVLGILLMLLGVGIISLLTANFSAYIISRGTDSIKQEEDQLLNTVNQIQKQLSQIQKTLAKIEENNHSR